MNTLPNPFPHRYDIDTLSTALMGESTQYLNTQTGLLQAEETTGTYSITPLPADIKKQLATQPNAPHLLKTMVLEWLKANNLTPPSLLHVPSGFAPQTVGGIHIQPL